MFQLNYQNGCILVCILVILFFMVKMNGLKEGMETASSSATTVATVATNGTNGIAGNASGYAANVKLATVQLQDTLLISKYRPEYENAILNLDDWVNATILKTVLSIQPSSSDAVGQKEQLSQLAQLQQVKSALDSAMKYVDNSA
jgi:hypothetical protein